MADKTLSERLQPSLLDRLTDRDPTNPKETRDARVIDVVRLREIIQRDLSWLLNTTNIEDRFDAEAYPHVAESVLNYGVNVVSGELSTRYRAEMIRKSIERAITEHEPRIIKGSVDVVLRTDAGIGEMTVALDIHADMWAQPMPLELYLRSNIDIATGEVSIEGRR